MRQKPKPGTSAADPHGLHESHHMLQSFGGSRILAVFAILVIYSCMSMSAIASLQCPITSCHTMSCFNLLPPHHSASRLLPITNFPSTPILFVAVLGPSSPLIILALLFFQPFGSTASFAAAAFFLLFLAYPFLVDVQPSPAFARFLLCASAWFKKGPTLWLEQGLVEEIEARPVDGSMWCYHPHGTGVGFGFLINVRGHMGRR